jgi:pantoate--beta-alanine ligase
VQVLRDHRQVPTADGLRLFVVFGREWVEALGERLARALRETEADGLAVVPATGDAGAAGPEAFDHLVGAGIHFVYAPSAAEFWPRPMLTRVQVGGAFRRHGAAFRPGHYETWATAGVRLEGLLRPVLVAEFGSDFQWMALWRTVRHDLALPGEHRFLAAPREPDGLLVHPDNRRLSGPDRVAAGQLYQVLEEARRIYQGGEVEAARLLGRTSALLMRIPGFRVQYLALVDPSTLTEKDVAEPGDVLLTGGFFGAVRLEDHLVLP